MATGQRSSIRIANGAGFWGDNLDAPVDLVRSGEIDVLTLEYLAELTLAILAHQRAKDPSSGFVGDFPDVLLRIAPDLAANSIRIVTNAGGLNPESCARKCGSILASAGLEKTPLGVVSGDDVLPRIGTWLADGVELLHLETGDSIATVQPRLVSANCYLGAEPIAGSLNDGARFVITGRVADASLTLGPAAAHFGWNWADFPRLAGASVSGHLIECGAQATGGLWHRWGEIDDLAGVGYPIAEVFADGSSRIGKPRGSGGMVSVANMTEQLMYEIDDPACYRTPDVDVDLTTVSIDPDGPDRVRVSGATGRAPSDRLKIAAVYRDGWTASGMVAVVGRDAEPKARAAGRIVIERVRRGGFDLGETLVECLGAGDVAPGVVRPKSPPFEVVLRVTARDPRREAIERFCREFAPLITSGPPGLAGYASGRPLPRPAFGYFPTLVPRSLVEPIRETRPAAEWVAKEAKR